MLGLFLFHIDYTIYANNVLIKTTDIELIIKYRVIWIPSVLTVFSLKTFFTGDKSSGHVLTMNKPQLVSFFVYRRQSRDRFRIVVKELQISKIIV